MATDTTTPTTVESGDKQQRRVLRALQHIGAVALLASFMVTYAVIGIVANEVLAPVIGETPLWFSILVQTASGMPIVVALGLAGHYTSTLVVEKNTVDAWRVACYCAAVAAVGLPVMNLLMPSMGAF